MNKVLQILKFIVYLLPLLFKLLGGKKSKQNEDEILPSDDVTDEDFPSLDDDDSSN